MKSIAVIGLDKFGITLATTLAEQGIQVLAVDKSEETVQKISNFVTNAVVGDPTNEQVLKAADIKSFGCAVVCLSGNMEESLLATLTLKEMNLPKVIARATSAEHKKVLEKIGADEVIYPEQDMARKLAYRLDKSEVLDYLEFSKDYSIIETKVPLQWVGKSLKSLNVRNRYGINVIAISRKEENKINISPNPETPLLEDDILVLVGSNNDIAKITS